MTSLSHLFDNNRHWVQQRIQADPEFFQRLSHQQSPQYLWIGCSDSRVPANDIVGLLPGELFVHRNIANLVSHSDMDCLSVLQYAVEVLKTPHIIVCGHYGCGGVAAALDPYRHSLIDNWLRPIGALYKKHLDELNALHSDRALRDRLCELNVIEQVINVANTTIVQAAWHNGQSVSVQAWIYNLANGLLIDLGADVSTAEELNELEKRIGMNTRTHSI